MRRATRASIALAFALPAAIVGVVAACTNLSDIPASVCGNSIVEPDAGEQCDNFPLLVGDASYACFAPDSGGAACHIACRSGTICPTGWACGADDVCRQPSGRFAAPKAGISADVRSLALADFNGDHRLDVLTHGAGTTNVQYFDTGGNLAQTSSLNISRGQVAQGDLTGGGLADLIVLDSIVPNPATGLHVFGTGVDLWQGQSSGALATTLFPTFPLNRVIDTEFMPAPLNLPTSAPSSDDLLAYSILDGLGAVIGLVGGNQIQLLDLLGVNADGGVTEPLGAIPVGRVNSSVLCDSVVVAPAYGQVAQVFQPCVLGDAGTPALNVNFPAGAGVGPTSVTFPTPILGPMFIVDDDGDGKLDLVTSTLNAGADGASAWGVEIAYGNGDGTFVFRAPTPTFRPVPLLSGAALAVGFIDGDKVLDYVGPDEVILSTTTQPIPTSTLLVDAKIEDLNNDGFVDAVGVSNDGIDFYSGTGGPLMNHRFYDLPATKSFAVGDIDGDFNEDVIVANSLSPASISVMYGQRAGFPQSAALIGTVSGVAHMSTGKVTWFFGDPPDAIDSIAVTSVDSSGALSVVPIQGKSDRQPVGPLILTRAATDAGMTGGSLGARDIPVSGAIGNVPFTSQLGPDASIAQLDASLVLLGVASDVSPDASKFKLQLWSVGATTSSTILGSSTVIEPHADSVTMHDGYNVRSAGMATLDCDPSKNNGEEVVIVVPSARLDGNPPPDGMFYVLGRTTPNSNAWSLLDQEPFDGYARYVGGEELPVKVTRADFNGDGLEDLLLVYSSGDAVLAKVLFNDGTGALSYAKGIAIPIPADAGGAAPINLLGQGTLHVAVASGAGVTFYAFDASANAFAALDGGAALVNVGITEPDDIVVGDVNGDGVDDLVVSSVVQFTVTLGVPVIQ